MRIGNREVGQGHKTLVVAELSGEHRGDWDKAKQLVICAAWAGADMVKTQCFTPEAMTLDVDDDHHRLTWAGQERTLYDLYAETAMPLEWHARLKALCEDLGLLYSASVFDQTGIDLMVSLGVPALKIASFELSDGPLIRACAATHLPLVLSTGMAMRVGILGAVIAAEMHGAGPLVLLKCTSAYPAPVSDANLATIPKLVKAYRRAAIGLSDHTRSNAVVAAAVTLGACVVERHLTLNRSAGGPDAAFSDEPAEFKRMVETIRETEAALGTVHYGPTESELPMLRFRRSLWAVRDIKAGEMLTSENVRSLRPADGLPPSAWDDVLGKRARVDIARATPLSWDLLE